MSCNVICLLNNCIGRSVAAEPGTEGAFAPSLFGVGDNQCKMPPPLFRLGTFLSGVKMPKVSQIFKIKWFRWLQIALFQA